MDFGLYDTPLGDFSAQTSKVFEPQWFAPEGKFQ
jgi:hypothetical protein